MTQFVYSFNEGSKEMKDILGSKGANLAEMTGIGLPVPFGFTISTEACRRFFDENQSLGKDLEEAISEKITELENVTGKVFGSAENPLLVSVRSGAPVSMPGVLDTILNIGLNDETVIGLAALTESRRFAFDSYSRFIRMFAVSALNIPAEEFAEAFGKVMEEAGAGTDLDLTAEDFEKIVEKYKEIVKSATGKDFPQNPQTQLFEAVKAVFRSWCSDKAAAYRKLHKIPHAMGTAANVQAMVFGNMGSNSCTGVAFTRDPETGEKVLAGKFLVNAQGEDVMHSVRKPLHIREIEDVFPESHKVLVRISELLERHYKDVQDIEFTIENNKIYMLQTRGGRKSACAAVKTAVDMAEEGLIDKSTAIARVEPAHIEQLLEKGSVSEDFSRLMEWADEIRDLKVRADADNGLEAALAVQYGADGIGICRTEHMFFGDERLPVFRKMILADNYEEKTAALAVLRTFQQSDFKDIFKVMGDRPVTIRLLDPFMPSIMAGETDEENPLLGNRGCRLAIMTPEIAEMQTEAIICAALEVKAEYGIEIVPEIMVPLVSTAAEFEAVKKMIVSTADRCIAESGMTIDYLVGTMIETPRAALTADEIAENADFFSIGTNDLTEMTFGLSQADTADMVAEYTRQGILDANPFRTLDMRGVGRLIKTACELGRQVKPRLRIGLCGVHGGDPDSIEFCHEAGMQYVSCHPAKVPVAILAAARAAVKSTK